MPTSLTERRPSWLPLLAIALIAVVPLAAACGGSSASSAAASPTIEYLPAGTTPTSAPASPTAVPSPSAAASPTAAASATTAASPTATTPAGPVTVDITAKNTTFNKSQITVPAGVQVTINMTNDDAIFHNFAVYTAKDAKTAIGTALNLFKGPNVTKTLTITAPSTPGTYWFQCDVHPDVMNGSFIVK